MNNSGGGACLARFRKAVNVAAFIFISCANFSSLRNLVCNGLEWSEVA